MTEKELSDLIVQTLSEINEEDNKFSLRLFKQVVENNVPPWTTLTSFPAVASVITSSEYVDSGYGGTDVTTRFAIYIYNKYRTVGLNLPDIISYPLKRVRDSIENIKDPSIISIGIKSALRDNGTILPYTVAEVILEVTFREPKSCGM